jgi:hypothetical protein
MEHVMMVYSIGLINVCFTCGCNGCYLLSQMYIFDTRFTIFKDVVFIDDTHFGPLNLFWFVLVTPLSTTIIIISCNIWGCAIWMCSLLWTKRANAYLTAEKSHAFIFISFEYLQCNQHANMMVTHILIDLQQLSHAGSMLSFDYRLD